MGIQNIEIQDNSLEYSVTVTLGEWQISLIAMRKTEHDAAHVAVSIVADTEMDESPPYARYAPQDFRELLESISLPFWEALA